MTGDGNPSVAVAREDIIHDDLASDLLIDGSLTLEGMPQQIIFGEPCLNLISGEVVMDIGLVAASITSVATDALTEELLDGWDEGVTIRELKSAESDVCSL